MKESFGNVFVVVAPIRGVARERVPEGFKRSPFGSKPSRKVLTRTCGGAVSARKLARANYQLISKVGSTYWDVDLALF
eukprot:COSAG05_NODE_2605_length_2850_cov_3.223192_3_plen_78_part_00